MSSVVIVSRLVGGHMEEFTYGPVDDWDAKGIVSTMAERTDVLGAELYDLEDDQETMAESIGSSEGIERLLADLKQPFGVEGFPPEDADLFLLDDPNDAIIGAIVNLEDRAESAEGSNLTLINVAIQTLIALLGESEEEHVCVRAVA